MPLYIMQTLSDVWVGVATACSELVVVAPSPMGISDPADEGPLHPFVLTYQTISLGAQGLCEGRGGRPGLPVPNGPYGLRGRKATLNEKSIYIQASSLLTYDHRDRTDHQGQEAQDINLDFHTAPELCDIQALNTMSLTSRPRRKRVESTCRWCMTNA